MPKILVGQTDTDYRNLKPGKSSQVDSMRFCDRIGLPRDNDKWIDEYRTMDDFRLFNKMTRLFDLLTSLNPDLRFIAHKMIGHFRSRAGSDFSDPALDKIVSTNVYFLRWVALACTRIRTQIEEANGIVDNKFQVVRIPTFGFTESDATWLEAPINKIDDSIAKGSGMGILVHYV